ncbi:MAG: Do family serine endopeptidase [Gammaproteobacteria bacterium]
MHTVFPTASPRSAPRSAIPLLLAALVLPLAAPAMTAEGAEPRPLFRHVEMADVIAAARPSVVKIDVTKAVNGISPMAGQSLPFGGQGSLPDFLRRFGPFGPQGQGRPPARVEGVGSGFIIDEQGHVVTNNHVIDGAEEMTLTLHDGTTVAAKLVGSDPLTDLALLRIEDANGLTPIAFGDSDSARVGDWVVAIGNPYGFGGSATAGIISARGRDIRSGPYDDFLQIDAPINSGNSGGPIVDASGKVIGVNTAIFSPNGGNIGIGFAIPAAEARRVIDDLKIDGSVTRGWLGVQIQDVTEDVAAALQLDEPHGALVADVIEAGPAERAGVRPGDIILRYGDTRIEAARDLSRAVARTAPGSKVPLEVQRQGRKERLVGVIDRHAEAGLAAAPDDAGKAAPGGAPLEGLGLALGPISPDMRRQMNLDADVAGALIVGIKSGSSADTSGMRPGDVIVQVNQQSIDGAKAAERAIIAARDAERPIVVLIRRGTEQFFTTMKLA